MLDMGFIHDIRRVLTNCQRNARTCCSLRPSLTILKPGGKTVAQPAGNRSGTPQYRSDQVTQHVHFVDKKRKRELLRT